MNSSEDFRSDERSLSLKIWFIAGVFSIVSKSEMAHDTVMPKVIGFLVIAVNSPDKATNRSWVSLSSATCLAILTTRYLLHNQGYLKFIEVVQSIILSLYIRPNPSFIDGRLFK